MNVFVECFIGIGVNRCSVVGSRKHLLDTVFGVFWSSWHFIAVWWAFHNVQRFL